MQTPKRDPRPGGRARIEAFLNARWYGQAGILHLLQPIAWLYAGIAAWRRRQASAKAFKNLEQSAEGRLPTIVVGNLVAGGTGKTPVVAMLVDELKALGAKPGIVSRGYGGRSKSWPLSVTTDLDPALCGDEAVELAQITGCPVVAGPDRRECVAQLSCGHDCNVVVSDDGLQHYPMARDMEIVLVDAQRRFGNGYLLPVGPLREPIDRILEAQLLLVTARSVAEAEVAQPELVEQTGIPSDSALSCALVAATAQPLLTGDACVLAQAPFVSEHCVALSGIGAPERFHQDLESLGCSIEAQAFADHHNSAGLISSGKLKRWAERNWVVTTGKDAVKLRFQLSGQNTGLAAEDYKRVWVLKRELILSQTDLAELRRVLGQFVELKQLGSAEGVS